jgi:hypothetical protein
VSIDAACAVLTFDVPPTQAPLTRGFLCAREWQPKPSGVSAAKLSRSVARLPSAFYGQEGPAKLEAITLGLLCRDLRRTRVELGVEPRARRPETCALITNPMHPLPRTGRKNYDKIIRARARFDLSSDARTQLHSLSDYRTSQ